MSSANISSFFPINSFTGGNPTEPVRVISDPEGYHINQLANSTHVEPKILVLGDLLDYTLGRGDNFNNFASTNMESLRLAKSHSLESVKYSIDNPSRIKVLFGNRDLNKLKLLPLALIKNSTDNTYTKWWESGNTYLESARELKKQIEDGSATWAVESMANWKPFWNSSVYKENKRGTHWNTENPRLSKDTTTMSFLERYYLIFGLDCDHGTISAQNNIFGIAQECDVYDEIFGKFGTILDNIPNKDANAHNYLLDVVNTSNNPEFKEACETAAALVFTVFADALYGAEPTTNKRFSGVLRNFFLAENTYYCAYAKLANDLLLFSHGGMRAEFFLCSKPDGKKFSELVQADDTLTPMLAEQLGGYYAEANIAINESDIIKRINNYNNEMKTGLKTIFEEYATILNFGKPCDKSTVDLMVNIIISVPYKGSIGSCIHKDASPIMVGVNDYRAKPIVVSDSKTILYQFIGHAPTGFAPLIDKYTNPTTNSVSYLVNLDTSNSLMGQKGLLNPDKIGENYSYVGIVRDSGVLKFKSNVNVQIVPQYTENEKQISLSEIAIKDFNLLNLGEGFKGTKTVPVGNTNHDANYHGEISIGDKKYHLFTYTTLPNFTVKIYVIPTGITKTKLSLNIAAASKPPAPTKPDYSLNPSVKTLIGNFQKGGKSMRRRHNIHSATAKRRPMKLKGNRARTMVKRRPQLKRTVKKN